MKWLELDGSEYTVLRRVRFQHRDGSTIRAHCSSLSANGKLRQRLLQTGVTASDSRRSSQCHGDSASGSGTSCWQPYCQLDLQ
jgi:hypothetical protein